MTKNLLRPSTMVASSDAQKRKRRLRLHFLRCNARCQYQVMPRKWRAKQEQAPVPLHRKIYHLSLLIHSQLQPAAKQRRKLLFYSSGLQTFLDRSGACILSHCSSLAWCLFVLCGVHNFLGITSTLWRA